MADVVVISDTDSEPCSKPVSPLTSVKSRPSRSSSKKRPVKRLAKNNKAPKNQPKLNSFFQTLTVKATKSSSDLSLENVACDSPSFLSENLLGDVKKPKTSLKDLELSPLKISKAVKRSALKGLSPQAKAKPKLTELKGDELWKAVVAQRKKPPKSLNSEFEDLEKELTRRSPQKEDIVDLLMTEQVVHSFPNDIKNKTRIERATRERDAKIKDEMQKALNKFKERIPDVVPEDPVPETTPIFKPKQRITIKKKRKDTDDEFFTSTQYATSTPTKDGPAVSTSRSAHKGLIDGSLDLFSDNSLLMEEWGEVEPALCEQYGRHTVIDCSVGDLNTVLLLKNMQGENRTCELQGFWADTHLKPGIVVNILGEFDSNGYICIDMKQDNLLVVNPDFLVSGSVIASSTICVRKSVLNTRYKGYDAGNKYMLFGSILHEIFQKVLVSDVRDPVQLRKMAESIAHCSSYAHDMYSINMPEKSLIDGIDEYIPPMISFLSKHVDKNSKTGQADIRINEVRDIEETVWSPRFGMKGKIDATVECQVKKNPANVVPLELKTGRPSYSAEHKGQVTMYSMMLAEKEQNYKYHSNLKPGLLVYLKDGTMQEVKQAGTAIKGLVNLRNELCHGLLLGITRDGNGEDSTINAYTVDPLPEPISNSRICDNCPHLITCSLHQSVFGDYKPYTGHVMEKLVPNTLSHLTNTHLEYFAKWSKLLLIESSMEAKWKTIRDVWTKPVKQRVSSGLCLTGLTVSDISESTAGRYSIKLSSHTNIPSTNKLNTGDLVIISEADSKVVIYTTGSIIEKGGQHVTLLLDRKMLTEQEYCIDKYDYYTGDGTGFTNLARLMENTSESAKLRDLIIDKREPQFDDFLDDECEERVEPIISSLNKNQKLAVTQGLLTRDYLVIKGYPGTGKTSTIVALVEALRKQGISVLITSYTHSAVDNILLKLKQRDNVEFLRLGRSTRVHPDIVPHSSEYLTKDLITVDQVSAFYSGYHVVGTTCLGITHPMLVRRRFDVCIVDEASQILQPVSLGPLFYASRFILVGDNKQLPPLIKSTDAKSLGMEETLLDCLEKCDPTSCVELTHQYRMNEEIMRLSNKLIYEDKLSCGNKQIQTNTISHHIDRTDAVNDADNDDNRWIARVTSSDLRDSLMFLNTESCGYSPTKKTTIHSNTEARLVSLVCKSLVEVGVPGSAIGVITPYQAQVQLLKSTIGVSDIEVNTVDQYQGRDKSVIVISFARTTSNHSNASGRAGILSDMRRLNVAITRAKHKMILIGNLSVIQSYQPVRSLIKLLREDQVIRLPPLLE